MTRPEKQRKDDPQYKANAKASEFLKRIKVAKLEPLIVPYADTVSGLFENSEWKFVCSEHVAGRFSDEKELYEHYKSESHRRSVKRRSSSMYD
jgi:hypothetical protein